MATTYFLSDVHLGAQSEDIEKTKQDRLLSFFDHVDQSDGDLIIVGDLFDFWFEYVHVVPRLHFRVLAALSNLAAKKPVRYLAGNHDFWLNSFMTDEVGLIIYPDYYIMEDGGKRFYITHGDGLLKNDYGYRFLKKVLRNKINIFLYRLLHPDVGVPFALLCSHGSRNSARRRKKPYTDFDYRQFAFQKIDEGFDFVVLGHTHWAAVQQHGHGFYLNPGYWGKFFSYIVVKDGDVELLSWNGTKGDPFHTTLPPGNPAI